MDPAISKSYSPYEYPEEWYDEVRKLNIYQRLHGAMADAKPVAKTEKQGVKFKFHGHEAVSAMVKGLAEKWRFVVESSVKDHHFETTEIYGKPRILCILTVRVRFRSIDAPDEFVDLETVGYGVDESDKGPGKALSYALKMAQLKTFLIHDGEKLDNEEFCYQHEREEKALIEAKQKWAKLIKRLGYDMKEEGARMKREYGDPPSLESILLDCEDLVKILEKEATKKKAGKAEAPAEPETVDDVNPAINDPEGDDLSELFPDQEPKATFKDQG